MDKYSDLNNLNVKKVGGTVLPWTFLEGLLILIWRRFWFLVAASVLNIFLVSKTISEVVPQLAFWSGINLLKTR